MEKFDTDTILQKIHLTLEKSDINSAIQILESLRSADQSEVFDELDSDQQLSLLPHLDPTISADILEDISDNQAYLYVVIDPEIFTNLCKVMLNVLLH